MSIISAIMSKVALIKNLGSVAGKAKDAVTGGVNAIKRRLNRNRDEVPLTKEGENSETE